MHTTNNHRDIVAFHLSIQDRDLILRHAQTLDAQIKNRFLFGRKEGGLLSFELSTAGFIDLLAALAHEADGAPARSVRRSMGRLHDKLGALLDSLHGAGEEPAAETFRNAPPELREELQKIAALGPFDSIDQINEKLRTVSSEYNNRPRDEFQGLSPAKLHKLLSTPWNAPEGALQFADNLDDVDLRNAPIIYNTRAFLTAMIEQKGVKATATSGNLNRKFLERMLETMQWPAGFINELRLFNKVVNEEDVMPLHVLRIVLAGAGLIRRAKGTFTVTRAGQDMIDEKNEGRLFALLFHFYFRKFNLAYLDAFEECPGIQQTIGYSLYVIHRLADDWQNSEELAEKVFLPSVREVIPTSPYGNRYEDFLARSRILGPLLEFGLIECTYLDDPAPFEQEMDRVRKTPLFDRFITFTLSDQ